MWVTDMRRPSFQFYPGDWQRDTALRLCSIGARGCWVEMLCIMHQAEPYGYLMHEGKALGARQVASLIGGGATAKQVQEWLDELEAEGVFARTEDDCIFSRRMVRDEQTREARANGGKGGAEHGVKGAEHGKKGGRPKTERGDKKPPLKPPFDGEENPPLKPPPSSSSSSSIKTSSEPSGSGAADAGPTPPPAAGMTAQEFVWAHGVPVLVAAGQAEAKARSLLGKWVKGHGANAVQSAILRCVAEQPVEPVSWLTAVLGKPPSRVAIPASGDLLAREWWVEVGFSNQWEAENAGCTEGNRWMWENRQQVRTEQDRKAWLAAQVQGRASE